MASYSIKDLEVLSGIKAHTLRIWEQRYNIIAPMRSDTNIRQYTSEDLKLLLNISLLNENGYKISKIATMGPDDLRNEVLSIADKHTNYSDQIHLLTIAMIEIDEARFEKIIANNILQFGLEKTMINIVYPFLAKVGLMWQTGSINPGQEHFMSNLIRQKLIVAIDGQYNNVLPSAKKFLLFLPEGELHELSLLFCNYIIKSRQHKTVYLGQWLPFQDLQEIYASQHPDYIVTILTGLPDQKDVQKFVNKLGENFKECKILLSGYQIVAQDIKIGSNMSILSKLTDLSDLLDSMA